MRLNEGSLTPLYQQLMEDIKCAIEEGRYQPEEKIPSESELSELYSVSRITVRRAVDELCAQGYLVKKQGKGTYVGRAKLQRKLPGNNTMSFTDVCRLNGQVHSCQVLTCRQVPARQDEIKFLGLEPAATLLYIQRLHMADGVPIQLENNFYPLDRFSFLKQEDLEHDSPSASCGSGTGSTPATPPTLRWRSCGHRRNTPRSWTSQWESPCST